MCQLPLHHKYQPSSGQSPCVLMKAYCIRLKLLEVNYLQVSILTIKVFLTYLTYFNQNYFLHSNILSTWDGFMFTYPYYYQTTIFPCPKNYVGTRFKLFHYTYYFNWIKIISLTEIYFPLNIF